MTNLPIILTPFIGREEEIEEISNLLDEANCRLLSLIGLGGMGKTRLAIEVAKQKMGAFPDGVFFIALQSLRSIDNITSAIANVLEFPVQSSEIDILQQISDYLSTKQLLLIMDNFEHLLDGADVVAEILRVTSGIKILVTSREALNLRLEWVRPLSGMAVPEISQDIQIENYSAIKLFVQRARLVRESFSPEDELDCVIRICRLVGGMPLGIELAVSWLKSLPCNRLADEIQANADILKTTMRDVPERHQSIRAVFNYSWTRLRDNEKMAFARLSIFQSAPTLQAIEAVTGANLLTIMALVDKALISQTDGGRYQFHELSRSYAYEKLLESGELENIQDNHSHYYLHFLQEREQDIHGNKQLAAADEIEADFENIRAGWYRAVDQKNYDDIGGAVECLCVYLWLRSRWWSENHLITYAQEHFAPHDNESPHLVWAMLLARNMLNSKDSLGDLEEAIRVAEKSAATAEIALYQLLRGHALGSQNRPADAIQQYHTCIPYFESVDHKFHLAAAYNGLGRQYRFIGDHESSIEYLEKAINLQRMYDDVFVQIQSNEELSQAMFIMGNLQEAERYRQDAILVADKVHALYETIYKKTQLGLYFIFGVHGNLNELRQLVQHIQQSGITESETNYFPQQHFGIMIAMFKCIFAIAEENYDVALNYGLEAFRSAENDPYHPIFAWGLLMGACEQGNYDTVREHNNKLLTFFSDHRHIPLLLLGISFSAILAAYDENNPERATELLALVSTHPGSMKGWLKIWAFIDRLKEYLETKLGTEAYRQAWERGKALEWQFVVNDLIAAAESNSQQVNDSTIPLHILEANAELLEPLSDRELEVLLKIAEGHTNHDIAELLFVGVSTVKKHITHIYGKLNVSNRAQAIIKLQEWSKN